MSKLKGVAHNVADSFTSLMNYDVKNHNYVMEELASEMAWCGVDNAEIDLMKKTISPSRVGGMGVKKSIAFYNEFLAEQLKKVNRDIAEVKVAKLQITRTDKRDAGQNGTQWRVYEAVGVITLKNGQTSKSGKVESRWLEDVGFIQRLKNWLGANK
ncbi:MAG: hypothetical protein KAW41_01575 [Candidatus Diapherotrites archaeon]|nr:hypothetical protein [Candidatus Diapherotrites archaeon]